MDTFLWVVQGVLAFVYLAAGFMKATRSKADLAPMMGYVEDFSAPTIKLIGVAEILGAVGLVVPQLAGIVPLLTPAAAAALAVLMLGAVATHVRRKEYGFMMVPLVLGGLAGFVAYGRFMIIG